MSENTKKSRSRREFLKSTGRVAAVTALTGTIIPHVHAAENNTIQLALIGCGGRGTGAAADALSSTGGPIKLVAMADVFESRLENSRKHLQKKFAEHADQIDVPKDRQFIGFDAYQKAMDCLKPGDVAIFATPLAFRGVHFNCAIQKGLHVFMEKPLTADGPTSRHMLKLADESAAKNLKVGVGLMSRHSRALQELHSRIQDGEIGDLVLLRAYRMTGPVATFFSERWPGKPSELLWQIQRFHSFIWASGGLFNDAYIHVVDHCCWMKNAWPIKAQALGGRHYRNNFVDQNFDTYSVEYTFADGCTLLLDGRSIDGCDEIYRSFANGTKGMAIVSKHGDCGEPSATYKAQTPSRDAKIWESEVAADQLSPYQNEWNDLMNAIRNDKPYNEVKRGVEASVVCNLGRIAAHTGVAVTYEDALNSERVYAPDVDKFTMDSPPPVVADADGKYPVPQPGIVTSREY